MVFVDPPYNVRIAGNVSGLGAVRHREFAMASGEMNVAEFTQFLVRACSLLAGHSAEGSLHYVCMDWRHLDELLVAGREVYDELLNVCVRATPFTVPMPNSYSRRICSNSSTFALLSIPSLLPSQQDAPELRGWAIFQYRSGPFESIEITSISGALAG